MNKNLKNLGTLLAGIGVNGYMMFHAVKANNKWNEYLAKQTPEEREKMQARDWFLKKHGRFFGSGFVLGERSEFDQYQAKSDEEKNAILTQYRWSQIRKIENFKSIR